MEATYDVFISYSSKYRENIARPLSIELGRLGFNVWYDEFEITIGDSLRKSIDHGILKSRYGLVIISPDFFEKNWTEYEYDSLFSRQMQGQKVILPLLCEVEQKDLAAKYPGIADLISISINDQNIAHVARDVGAFLLGQKVDAKLWESYYKIHSIHKISRFDVTAADQARLRFNTTGELIVFDPGASDEYVVLDRDPDSRMVRLAQHPQILHAWYRGEHLYAKKLVSAEIIEITDDRMHLRMEKGILSTLLAQNVDWENPAPVLAAKFRIGQKINAYIETYDAKNFSSTASLLHLSRHPGYERAKVSLAIGSPVKPIINRDHRFLSIKFTDDISAPALLVDLYGKPVERSSGLEYYSALNIEPLVVGFDDLKNSVVLGTYLQAFPSESTEYQTQVIVSNKLGLCSRPCGAISKMVKKYNCAIYVSLIRNGATHRRVEGGNVMGLMMLAAGSGATLHIDAKGVDALKGAHAVRDYIEELRSNWDDGGSYGWKPKDF